MSETRFPNGIKGGNGTDLELKSDTDIALYPADHIWISQGTKLIFEGTAPDDFEIKLQATAVTADRDVILPDSNGTLATQEWVTTNSTYLDADVDLHLNISTATPGQVLSWNGSDFNWIAQGGGSGSTSLAGLTDVDTTGVLNGNVLKYNSTTTTWEPAAESGGSGTTTLSRTTVSGTTSSIADEADEDIDITGAAKAYSIFDITVDAAAWVRVYSSSTARTADSTRLEGVDPDPDAGVLAEIITTGATTVAFTPSTISFNNDTVVTDTIYLNVTNKSGSTSTISTTMTILPLET